MNHYIYYRLILCSNVLNFAQVETKEWNDKVASALQNIYGENNRIKAYFACIVLFIFFLLLFFSGWSQEFRSNRLFLSLGVLVQASMTFSAFKGPAMEQNWSIQPKRKKI